MSRTCHECSECCTTLAVREIEKPAFSRCANVCSQGCSIYSERPASCAGFSCLWLSGLGKLADRPDKAGVVMDLQRQFGGGQPVIRAFVVRETDRGNEMIARASEEHVVVLYDLPPTRPRVIGPEAKVREFLRAGIERARKLAGSEE